MRFFKAILLMIPLLILTTCVQAQKMPKDVYKSSVKIELKLKDPNYDRVLELLEKAKVEYPDDAEIWFLLGKVYGIKDRPKDMLEAFTQANKLSLKEKEKAEMKTIIENTWITTFNQAVDYANKVHNVDRYSDQISPDFSNYLTYADSLELISSRLNTTAYSWKAYASIQDLPLEKLKGDLYTKSLELYELAMLLDSTRYEPYLNAAFISYKLNQPEKALSYYKKAYELKPDNPDVLSNYFSALINNKKYDDALKVSDEILKKDPNNLNVLFNRAVVLEHLGRQQETMELYNQIIEKDPSSKDVYFNRALLYVNKTSQIAKDLIAIRDSLQSNPNSQPLINKSKQLIEEQKKFFNKAELDFHKVLELSPDDLEAMGFLGYCLLNQEKIDDAIRVLETLVQKKPDNKEAWGHLSILYTKKGMAEKAKEAEKKAQ